MWLGTVHVYYDIYKKKIVLEFFGKWGSWSSCKPLKAPCGEGKRERTRCYWFYGRCYGLKKSKPCKVPCGKYCDGLTIDEIPGI